MKKSKVLYASILALLVVFASAMVIAFAVLSGREGDDPEKVMVFYNLAVWVCYALLLAALVMVVTFPVLRIVQNYKTYAKTLMGIAVVVGIYFISYAFSPATTGEFYTSHNVGPYTSRFINAGLITTYITMIATIVIFIYSEISGRVK